MTNYHDILAQKKAWRNAEQRKGDRRKKDRTMEEHKNLADALRAGKYCSCSNCEMQKSEELTDARVSMIAIGLSILMTLIILFILFSGNAHAQDINLDVIADIESSGEPLAYNRESGATGLYQITQPVIDTYSIDRKKLLENENAVEDTRMPYIEYLTDMYEPKYAYKVAYWFINEKIPQWLNNYNIPDTTTSRLIAYNWGIGHLRRWYKNGAHWNRLPRETRDYVKKYFREVNQ